MLIPYPKHIRWIRATPASPDAYFVGSNQKKVAQTQAALATAGVDYTITLLSEAFLDEFIPLYTHTLLQKGNARLHDVYQKTLGKAGAPHPYYALRVTEQGRFLGGTIFSLRPDRAAYVFRAYPRDWREAELSASPALMAEYFLAAFTHEHNLPYISHGQDRNPYGLHAAIGLAIFKLAAGFSVRTTKEYVVGELETNNLTCDALILDLPSKGMGHKITTATLVTLPEHEAKYLQVTKYPTLLSVTTIYRSE